MEGAVSSWRPAGVCCVRGLAAPTTSSPRRRGPITPGDYGCSDRLPRVIAAVRNHQRHGVWVPACAGTTLWVLRRFARDHLGVTRKPFMGGRARASPFEEWCRCARLCRRPPRLHMKMMSSKTWMAGTSPAMTKSLLASRSEATKQSRLCSLAFWIASLRSQ